MNQKTKGNLIYASKILIPLIIIIGLFLGGISAGIITFEPPKVISYGEVTATLVIDFGDGTTYSNVLTVDNSTVFDFLLEADKKGDITVKTTYSEQMGGYEIESITYQGSEYVHGKDYRWWWLFYINGQFATDSADKVYVQNDDLIEWKFESF